MGPRALIANVYRLLTEAMRPDTKFGWQSIQGIINSVANPKLGLAVLGLSIKRPGKLKAYVRYLNVHAPSVTVLVSRLCDDGITRYGFIEMERAYRPRLSKALFPADGRGYVQRLIEDDLWGELMQSPGTICTELVGGMVEPKDFVHVDSQSEEDGYRDAVIRAAIREVAQEMGIEVEVEKVFIDRTCPDPAHALHPQSIAIATAIEEGGKQNLDEDEASKKVRWFTLNEVISRIECGEIDDGRVLNALFFAQLLTPAA